MREEDVRPELDFRERVLEDRAEDNERLRAELPEEERETREEELREGVRDRLTEEREETREVEAEDREGVRDRLTEEREGTREAEAEDRERALIEEGNDERLRIPDVLEGEVDRTFEFERDPPATDLCRVKEPDRAREALVRPAAPAELRLA